MKFPVKNAIRDLVQTPHDHEHIVRAVPPNQTAPIVLPRVLSSRAIFTCPHTRAKSKYPNPEGLVAFGTPIAPMQLASETLSISLGRTRGRIWFREGITICPKFVRPDDAPTCQELPRPNQEKCDWAKTSIARARREQLAFPTVAAPASRNPFTANEKQ